MFEEMQRELNRIAAEPPHWSETRIRNWGKGSLVDEARKIQEPNWWTRRETAVAAVTRILDRAARALGLDDEDEPAQAKRERRERAAGGRGAGRENVEVADDEEPWRAYMGEPNDDARQWLKDLSAKIDMNVTAKKGWWGTLRDHVQAKPNGARIRDLDPRIVELCLKQLCED
jgi:hypothetical protein